MELAVSVVAIGVNVTDSWRLVQQGFVIFAIQ